MDATNQFARPTRPLSALVLVLCIAAYVGAIALGVSVLLHAIGATLLSPLCQRLVAILAAVQLTPPLTGCYSKGIFA
jgi:hypothetical protein